MSKTVLLGLSGGVDSSVCARLLIEQGYTVHAHWLDIGLGDSSDAQKVAKDLGIAFSTGAIREELEALVCKPFMQDYLSGRTPMPCARCNLDVKFPALFHAADSIGADFVATGHYANILYDEKGAAFLARGKHQNDQAYMLARLKREWLPRLIFPLGEYEKSDIRQLAHQYGIHVADKPDSMEICFVPDGDYAAWLERRGQTPPKGQFIDEQGNVLGEHKGIHHYTLGQRRGLGISAKHRLFVSAIHPETNEVVLSNGEDLFEKEVYCKDVSLLADMKDGQQVELRLRHSKNAYPAIIHLKDNGLASVTVLTEARAPTPGQLAVFYDGDIVLGSAWITSKPDET